MLSDGELNHILGKWISYKPASKAQVGNTTFMKSEINNVDPSSLHASYNAWQLKLQITWLLEYRCQPAVVPRTKAAMIEKWIDLLNAQTTTRLAPNIGQGDDGSLGESGVADRSAARNRSKSPTQSHARNSAA